MDDEFQTVNEVAKHLKLSEKTVGDMSLGGSVTPVESIAECLQVAFDAGAKKVSLPMASAVDIPAIPAELFTKFQTSSLCRSRRCCL